MNKRRFVVTGIVVALLIILGIPIYEALVPRSPLSVTFIGYTNSVRAVFAVTNTSNRPLQRWGWEEHSTSGHHGAAQLGPATLQPGQGEILEVSPGNWPSWRLAILTTDSLKEKWNQTLTNTPYVATNQWDQLWFDRSFSPWVPGPFSVPSIP